MSEVEVTEPTLEIVHMDDPKGFAVLIDGKLERLEDSAYYAECFVKGVQWAARNFGWASERLTKYGEQCDSALINSPHRSWRHR